MTVRKNSMIKNLFSVVILLTSIHCGAQDSNIPGDGTIPGDQVTPGDGGSTSGNLDQAEAQILKAVDRTHRIYESLSGLNTSYGTLTLTSDDKKKGKGFFELKSTKFDVSFSVSKGTYHVKYDRIILTDEESKQKVEFKFSQLEDNGRKRAILYSELKNSFFDDVDLNAFIYLK